MAGLARTTSAFGFGLVGTALAAACSGAYATPDTPPDGSAWTEPPHEDGGASPAEATVPDVRGDDAGTRNDGCGGCDCDNDGVPRGGCVEAGAPDGGVDCGDSDPRVRPNQDYLEDPPPPSAGGGDWNCSGTVERRYASSVICAGFGMGNCAGKEGFEGNPGCGQEGAYVFCQSSFFSCGVDATKTVTRKQGCR